MSTCCNIDEFEDDFVEDQSSFFSDDSDIDLDIGKSEGRIFYCRGNQITSQRFTWLGTE